MNFNIDMQNPDTKKFLKIFSITLGICLIIILPFFIYQFIYAKPVYDPSKQPSSELVSEDKLKAEQDSKSNGFLTSPVRTNFLIVGVDKAENLTDVIMVGSYISTTGQINLLSIPRDTYTTFSGDSLKSLRKINPNAPSVMKINSVYAYTKKEGLSFLQSTVENLLDINIDYYVKVDLEAFVKIVDAVGGIYFTVPDGGLKYSDPTQNLYINLKGGYQLLDGEAAEGLVRFRKGYATQDLQRVKVQQEFIKEFVKQVLNKETLISNLGEIILNLIKYVDTNFSLTDLPKYVLSISNIKYDNIQSETAKGNPQMINGASYYIINTEETKQIVDEYFYGNTDPSENTQDSQIEESQIEQTT